MSMPPRVASLVESMNSLDAASYFFVSSGIFIGITALLFFGLGLWLGRLLWGRYKRRLRDAEGAIESFKGEVALLKHRIAEQSTRQAPGMGPSPLQAIAFRAAVPKALSAVVEPAPDRLQKPPSESFLAPPSVTPSTAPSQPFFSPLDVFMVPRSRAFCLWTEEHWIPPVVKPAPAPEGHGFAVWTLPDFEPACGPKPPSRAHTVWTEPGWTSPRQPGPPNRSSRAFTLWTEPDWKPFCYLPQSRAFTLWTEPGWTSPRQSGPPNRSARAFTLWTEPGWQPASGPPRSRAFALWTEPDWSPAPVQAVPLPPSAAWSVWTSSGFEPACRGTVPASCAFSVWTEESWAPSPTPPPRYVASRAFTLWAEPPPISAEAPERVAPESQTAVVSAAASAVASITPPQGAEPARGHGLMSRAIAAAKQAFGLKGAVAVAPMPVPDPSADPQVDPPSTRPTAKPQPSSTVARVGATGSDSASVPTPARTLQPAKVIAKPSAGQPINTAAKSFAPDTPHQPGKARETPKFGSPQNASSVPPSKAFTVWADSPAFEFPAKTPQSIGLPALIESKLTGKVPSQFATTAAPSPTLPPVPAVPSSPADVDAGTPGFGGAVLLPPLDLEPLELPEEPSGRAP